MCTMLAKINTDLTGALKSKNAIVVSVVRMVKAAIKQQEIDNKKIIDTDEEILAIISKEIKWRRDAVSEANKTKRTDIVNQRNQEIDILMSYCPKQLTETEIKDIIDKAIVDTNATSVKDMGKVMAAIKPLIIGKADMKIVSNTVRNTLS